MKKIFLPKSGKLFEGTNEEIDQLRVELKKQKTLHWLIHINENN